MILAKRLHEKGAAAWLTGPHYSFHDELSPRFLLFFPLSLLNSKFYFVLFWGGEEDG